MAKGPAEFRSSSYTCCPTWPSPLATSHTALGLPPPGRGRVGVGVECLGVRWIASELAPTVGVGVGSEPSGVRCWCLGKCRVAAGACSPEPPNIAVR